MPHIDFFIFFRLVLEIVVGIYATAVTLQSVYGWYVYLQGGDRYLSMIRRYLLVHGLRVRFKTFWGDVVVSILLSVALVILWHAHTVLAEGVVLQNAGRIIQPH
ncbi:MAG: hypothetical protein ABSG31_05100 [Tepidisphaeraceae bacterium]|jgi:hypothetical protein